MTTAWIILAGIAIFLMMLYLTLELWVGHKRVKYKIANLKKLAGNATDKELKITRQPHGYKNLGAVVKSYWYRFIVWYKTSYQHFVDVLEAIQQSYKERDKAKQKATDIGVNPMAGRDPTPKGWNRDKDLKLGTLDTDKLREDADCFDNSFYPEEKRTDYLQNEDTACKVPFTLGGKKTEGELKYENREETTRKKRDDSSDNASPQVSS